LLLIRGDELEADFGSGDISVKGAFSFPRLGCPDRKAGAFFRALKETKGAMAYWLFKTEPEVWSWADQVKKGGAGEEWDHVRNHLAKKHMQSMKKGDLGFFYHSVNEKRIMGVVKVVALAHPDSTDPEGKWQCVDVAAERPLPRPVTLAAVKAEPRLAQMALVKNARLSVQPVTAEEWALVCAMGGLDWAA
jgi:predicted RNA-binding protein with PUA-like domain